MIFYAKNFPISIRRYMAGVLLLLAMPVMATEPEPINHVENFLLKTSTLSAEFNQVLLDERGQILAESHGTMAIKRPGRFRWHYTAPEELLVMGDGSQIWSYDVELENATVASQVETLSGNPAALLAGNSDAADAFEVKKSWRAETVDWVELVPKHKQRDFQAIRLGFNADVLVAMELHDQLGQTTSITFDRVLQNQPIGDELFVFTPPEGVDVISAGGMAP